MLIMLTPTIRKKSNFSVKTEIFQLEKTEKHELYENKKKTERKS